MTLKNDARLEVDLREVIMEMKDFFDFMKSQAYPTIQVYPSDIGPK